MSVHRLKIIYSGGIIAEQRMPRSLEEQLTDGAQIFLGAHAAYFTQGSVPDRIMQRTAHYKIHDIRHDSPEVELDISLLTPIAASASYYLAKLAAKFAADQAEDLVGDHPKEGFKTLVLDSFAGWQRRRPLSGAFASRIEPILDMSSGAEEAVQRRRLYAHLHEGLSKITVPIRRTATHVDLFFDGMPLGQIAHRIYTEAEISEGLLQLQRKHETSAAASSTLARC